MSQLARDNGWHGFDNAGTAVGGMWRYQCDGYPSVFGCGNEITISRKYSKVGNKKSGWLVCYGIEDDGEDHDVVLTFCPRCTKVVKEQEKSHG